MSTIPYPEMNKNAVTLDLKFANLNVKLTNKNNHAAKYAYAMERSQILTCLCPSIYRLNNQNYLHSYSYTIAIWDLQFYRSGFLNTITILVHLDDKVVLGSDSENSLNNLWEALDRFRHYNLRLPWKIS